MDIINRWDKDFKDKRSYDSRLELMSKYITEDSVILDIGCGNKKLKEFLPENCKYTGIDIFKTYMADREVIKCDLNKKYPEFKKKFDYIICSGVIEYLYDVPGFIKYISELTNKLVVSYSCSEDYSKENIVVNNWQELYSKDDFIGLLNKNGFNIKNEEICYETQKIFYCEK